MNAAVVAAEGTNSVAREASRPFRVGGLSFIAVGVLYLVKLAFDVAAGTPPTSGTEILAWRASQEFNLAMGNEAMFFAAGFLIPAVMTLYRRLARVDGTMAGAACGLIATLIPTIFVLDIVQGRLAFPAWSVNTPAGAELVLALYYGGLHAVGLLLGAATVLIGIVMWRADFGRAVGSLGFVVAAFDVLGAYPDAIGPTLVVVSQVLAAAWFIALGSQLFRVREPAGDSSRLPQ
jgi:hypothetical protein